MPRSGWNRIFSDRPRRRRPVSMDLSSMPLLESRKLLTSVNSNLVRIVDFKPVNGGTLQVTYQCPDASQPGTTLSFDVYRSADQNFDSSDKWIGGFSDQPILGEVNVTEQDLGQGMRPDPSRPYVIIVARANGNVTETNFTDNTASFRKYTIAIISHGGIQGSSYNIPAWESKIAHQLEQYGYDRVIPFNWANKSRTPGAAARQAPRMAKRILAEASSLPADASIDLDYIAHSEGTVVVTQASAFLKKNTGNTFQTGYQRMSLLDPHAANPKAPNNAESTAGGIAGWFTDRIISWYKGNARDPLVRVPEFINETDVYYQRTPVSVNQVNGGLYNLLGQVPVLGTARYLELNSPLIAHSGGSGVYTWFYFNALPSFATGDQPKNPGILSASEVVVTSGSWEKNLLTTTDTRPVWSGQATPDSTVRLYLSHLAGENYANNVIVTSTTADHNGHWSIQPDSPLSSGNYKVQVRSIKEAGLPTPHRRMMPSVRLGVLRIPSTSLSKVTASSDIRSTKLSLPKRLNRNGIGLRLTDEPQTFQPGSAN